mgnify:CR=1 FL=1
MVVEGIAKIVRNSSVPSGEIVNFAAVARIDDVQIYVALMQLTVCENYNQSSTPLVINFFIMLKKEKK